MRREASGDSVAGGEGEAKTDAERTETRLGGKVECST